MLAQMLSIDSLTDSMIKSVNVQTFILFSCYYYFKYVQDKRTAQNEWELIILSNDYTLINYREHIYVCEVHYLMEVIVLQKVKLYEQKIFYRCVIESFSNLLDKLVAFCNHCWVFFYWRVNVCNLRLQWLHFNVRFLYFL